MPEKFEKKGFVFNSRPLRFFTPKRKREGKISSLAALTGSAIEWRSCCSCCANGLVKAF